jgi:hypothetical protein
MDWTHNTNEDSRNYYPTELLQIYRVSQEERSIFWEVIVPVILNKKLYMNMCPIPNGFRDRAIWIQTAKLLIRKRYLELVLFLIPVFIVQVTELMQFIINVRKFHIFTCFRQWRSMAGGKDNTGRPSQTTILSNDSISENVRNRTHVRIKFFLLEWPILWPPRILTLPPGTLCISRKLLHLKQKGKIILKPV